MTPLVVGVKLDKKHCFFIKFLRYSIGVCNNQNKKKSKNLNLLCNVYFVYFRKQKRKGSIEPFGSSRVKARQFVVFLCDRNSFLWLTSWHAVSNALTLLFEMKISKAKIAAISLHNSSQDCYINMVAVALLYSSYLMKHAFPFPDNTCQVGMWKKNPRHHVHVTTFINQLIFFQVMQQMISYFDTLEIKLFLSHTSYFFPHH